MRCTLSSPVFTIVDELQACVLHTKGSNPHLTHAASGTV